MTTKDCPKRRQSSLKVFVTRPIAALTDPAVVLQRTEEQLEAELTREGSGEHRSTLARLRGKGGRILHSKHMLLLIVVLNLIDCALVLGEIMLDIHYVKDLMEKTERTQLAFIANMQLLHPNDFVNYTIYDIDLVYERLTYENWTRCGQDSPSGQQPMSKRPSEESEPDTSYSLARKKRTSEEASGQSDPTGTNGHNESSETQEKHNVPGITMDEILAKVFHKTSIAILTFLLIESALKIICLGRAFFRHKLEVFDFLIVLGSFGLDLAFLKGLTEFGIRELVFILTFILPWRLIRVLNSLLVAVIDHEHFRMKLLYSEKKHIACELKELKNKEKRFDQILRKVESFCESEGIPAWKIRQLTVFGNVKQNTVSTLALCSSNLLNSMLEPRTGGSPNQRGTRSTVPGVVPAEEPRTGDRVTWSGRGGILVPKESLEPSSGNDIDGGGVREHLLSVKEH